MKQFAVEAAVVTQGSRFDVTPKIMIFWQNFLATR